MDIVVSKNAANVYNLRFSDNKYDRYKCCLDSLVNKWNVVKLVTRKYSLRTYTYLLFIECLDVNTDFFHYNKKWPWL